MNDCVFCKIATGRTETKILSGSVNVVEFTPLNPVVEGHTIFVPVKHVSDALEDPDITQQTMRFASMVSEDRGPCNFITSVGVEATQSVFHLHIHRVPRTMDDGLTLPWTGQV